jgi:hypothetical protein
MTNTTKHTKKNQEIQHIPSTQILEAIAKGVEARLVGTIVVNMVTIETICIARKLHISEEAIQEWLASRFSRSETVEDGSFLPNKGEGKLTPTNFQSSMTVRK